MPMSLFKNNKNRNKVVNPYCSLGWLLIITIFQKCAKLKPPWVHLGKQINYYVQINVSELEQNKQNNTITFFLLFIFLTKKWTSAVCGGVRAHPSHPPPPSLRACNLWKSQQECKMSNVIKNSVFFLQDCAVVNVLITSSTGFFPFPFQFFFPSIHLQEVQGLHP